MTLTLMDWFCGAGGSSQGAHAVPGVHVARAANHWDKAIESHASNFPQADHYKGDIRDAPVENWPACDIFWASPECTKWSRARGKKRDFHNTRQVELFAKEKVITGKALAEEMQRQREEEERSRALMDEVPKYLEGVQRRGGLVLAGVVENVIDEREWDEWYRWLADIHILGYRTRVIALNSMHAQPARMLIAPQSRDRLYVAYWHRSLGRDPDWDKWIRPQAWCGKCEEMVAAVQVFKRQGADMGRYRQQYTYRCPRTSCRHAVVEPAVLPAAYAIDWSIAGKRIGDRAKPLAEATMERIRAGMERYWAPLLTPAGGTWRDGATPVTSVMPTRTTTESDGLAVPPLFVPVEGRDGKVASLAVEPMRTQTTRNETGLAWLPFITELRGGGSDARSVADAFAAFCAAGQHHALTALPAQSGEHLLVPYYGEGEAYPTSRPVGAFSCRDRFALASPSVDIEDVLFRMLEPHEIGRGMAFASDYVVVGNKRQKVRQYGGAVTPPVGEVLVSALAECITGEDLDRGFTTALAGVA
ncbi:DNA cytosine methyltransferase [Streptosporangium sp. CA-115845]|uniref:DNA cytosine methyltransferase n=1 Tax=Streptosporangium sp. CA-115845 TaxID=3240071 RepID=UPI003D90F248